MSSQEFDKRLLLFAEYPYIGLLPSLTVLRFLMLSEITSFGKNFFVAKNA